MALAALHWRKLAHVVPAGSPLPTVAQLLDAIYTALTAATYYDGSSRTPGSGSAWTFSRYQNMGVTEAVYGTPPEALASDLRVIFAGRNGAATPTMNSPDTYVANYLLQSIAKGSSGFSAWDVASPFTTGDFVGYHRAWNPAGGSLSVQVYECEEAIAFQIERTDNLMTGAWLGALLDPESANLSDAEANGRVYGMLHGGEGALSMSFTTISSSFPFGNSGSAGTTHTRMFRPGVATVDTLNGFLYGATAITATNMSLPSGKLIGIPLSYRNSSLDRWAGRLREIEWVRSALAGQIMRIGLVDQGYIFAPSAISLANAIMLKY